MEVSADILFAQKATAVVKAAGMDPKLIDLEKFRQLAHIIISRAYHSIFETYPQDFIDTPVNQDDFIYNAQLIIDELLQRTDLPSLQQITGRDICFGSHKAIGIVVGALFAEGQRLWFEKVNSSDDNNRNNNIENQPATNFQPNPPQTVRTKNRPKSASMLQRTRLGIENTYIAPEHRIESPIKTRPLSANRMKPIPMKKLYELTTTSTSKHVNKFKSRIQNIENDMLDRQYDYLHNNNQNDNYSEGSLEKDRQLINHDDDDTNDEVSIVIDKHLENRRQIKNTTRAVSAPTRRVHTVSSRLYNVSAIKEKINKYSENEVIVKPIIQPTNIQSSQYTYDTRTGRRILLSQAEQNLLEKKRNTEAMGNIKELTDFDGKRVIDNNRPTGPTRPNWPGFRIGKSAEDWIKKQRSFIDPNIGKIKPKTAFLAGFPDEKIMGWDNAPSNNNIIGVKKVLPNIQSNTITNNNNANNNNHKESEKEKEQEKIKQLEKMKEIERLKVIEKCKELEKLKEIETLQEFEKSREKDAEKSKAKEIDEPKIIEKSNDVEKEKEIVIQPEITKSIEIEKLKVSEETEKVNRKVTENQEKYTEKEVINTGHEEKKD